jgi:hypothetical protein
MSNIFPSLGVERLNFCLEPLQQTVIGRFKNFFDQKTSPLKFNSLMQQGVEINSYH